MHRLMRRFRRGSKSRSPSKSNMETSVDDVVVAFDDQENTSTSPESRNVESSFEIIKDNNDSFLLCDEESDMKVVCNFDEESHLTTSSCTISMKTCESSRSKLKTATTDKATQVNDEGDHTTRLLVGECLQFSEDSDKIQKSLAAAAEMLNEVIQSYGDSEKDLDRMKRELAVTKRELVRTIQRVRSTKKLGEIIEKEIIKAAQELASITKEDVAKKEGILKTMEPILYKKYAKLTTTEGLNEFINSMQKRYKACKQLKQLAQWKKMTLEKKNNLSSSKSNETPVASKRKLKCTRKGVKRTVTGHSTQSARSQSTQFQSTLSQNTESEETESQGAERSQSETAEVPDSLLDFVLNLSRDADTSLSYRPNIPVMETDV